MERRSRSQTRRNEAGAVPGATTGAPQGAGRHASSSRVPENGGPPPLSYPRPPEQARTLSPDRRERYRSSGRGYPEGLASLPPPRPEPHPSSVPHSNSNSYNQYNSGYPLSNGHGELPPPRPQLPYSNGGGAPPRPEPPSGYQAQQPAPSPSKPPGAEQKPGGPLAQVTLPHHSIFSGRGHF